MNPKTLEALGPLAGGLFSLIDDLYTTEEERADARLKVLSLMSTEKVAQMAVNAKEADNPSMFVSGWRPAVGWICASALGWQFVLLPVFTTVVTTIAAYTGAEISFEGLITLDTATLLPILLGMLGLSVQRTYERTKGVQRNNIGGTPDV